MYTYMYMLMTPYLLNIELMDQKGIILHCAVHQIPI